MRLYYIKREVQTGGETSRSMKVRVGIYVDWTDARYAKALPEAYIMLSRPLESEICFACHSQLPGVEQPLSVFEALHYASCRLPVYQLFATLTTTNWH